MFILPLSELQNITRPQNNIKLKQFSIFYCVCVDFTETKDKRIREQSSVLPNTNTLL
jgi:hypothetical protein